MSGPSILGQQAALYTAMRMVKDILIHQHAALQTRIKVFLAVCGCNGNHQ
jgi:hypothetical protein